MFPGTILSELGVDTPQVVDQVVIALDNEKTFLWTNSVIYTRPGEEVWEKGRVENSSTAHSTFLVRRNEAMVKESLLPKYFSI